MYTPVVYRANRFHFLIHFESPTSGARFFLGGTHSPLGSVPSGDSTWDSSSSRGTTHGCSADLVLQRRQLKPLICTAWASQLWSRHLSSPRKQQVVCITEGTTHTHWISKVAGSRLWILSNQSQLHCCTHRLRKTICPETSCKSQTVGFATEKAHSQLPRIPHCHKSLNT